MTQEQREAAIKTLNRLIGVIEDDQAYSQMSREMYEDGYRRIDAYKCAIAALREQGQGYTMTADRLPDGSKIVAQPDPETGLVPCGCGGVPVVVNEPGSWGYYPERWHIRCCEDPWKRERCGMRTSSVETKEEAKRIWNTAMSGGKKNDNLDRSHPGQHAPREQP